MAGQDENEHLFRRTATLLRHPLGATILTFLFTGVAATLFSNFLDRISKTRDRGGPVFRNRMAALLRWILGSIRPPISPRLAA
jgi:hypothetical protein